VIVKILTVSHFTFWLIFIFCKNPMEGYFPRGKEPVGRDRDTLRTGKRTTRGRDGSKSLQPHDKPVTQPTAKELTVGSTVRGIVRNRKGRHVLVSLESDIVGYLPSDERLVDAIPGGEPVEPIGQFIQRGDSVLVAIASVTGNHTGGVTLTMNPNFMNRGLNLTRLPKGRHLFGAVRSVEDHGYTITIGLDSNIAGFLPKTEVGSQQLSVGQPLWLKMSRETKNARRALRLSLIPEVGLSLERGALITTASMANAPQLSLRGFADYLQSSDTGSEHNPQPSTSTKPATRRTFTKGDTVVGTVSSILEHQINIVVKRGVVGRIHMTEWPVDQEFPGSVEIGDTVSATVVDVVVETKRTRLEFTRRLPDDSPIGKGQDTVWDDLDTPGRPGVWGRVKAKTSSCLWVSLSTVITGRVSVMESGLEDVTKLNSDDPFADFQVGLPIRCFVLRVSREENHVDLALKNKIEGLKTICKITKVVQSVGFLVVLPSLLSPSNHDTVHGRIFVTDLSDDYEEAMHLLSNSSPLRVGSITIVSIVSSDQDRYDLSLRGSRMDEEALIDIRDPEIVRINQLAPGSKIRGFVRGVSKEGCFVNLGRGIVARVKLNQLSSEYVDDVTRTCPPGKLVQGRILSLNHETNKVEMSLKVDDEAARSLEMVREGRIFTGTVKAIEKYGVFVVLIGGLTGLCHRSELADGRLQSDLRQHFSPGQKLSVVVLHVDRNTRRISLSARESRILEAQDAQDDNVANIDAPADAHDEKAPENDVVSDGGTSEDGSDVDSSPVDRKTLEVSGGFRFEAQDKYSSTLKRGRASPEQPIVEPESTEENQDEGETPKNSSRLKREKKRRRQATEHDLFDRERALASSNATLETADDYERRLLGSPNSSLLWIRFMAFCVSLGQVDKAREISERALASISYRLEGEKLNVWLARINLEARHGSAEQAMAHVEQACREVDEKTLFLHLVESFYCRGDDIGELIFQSALRRLKTSEEFWILCGKLKFSAGEVQNARELLDRALASVPKSAHVRVILKFAQLEYRFGSAEQGRTLFEGLVGNFPRRLDLWSVFLDMETLSLRNGSGPEAEQVRSLYRRSCSLELSSKKMKFLFQRFLSFEKEFGTTKTVEAVKELARDYVASRME